MYLEILKHTPVVTRIMVIKCHLGIIVIEIIVKI